MLLRRVVTTPGYLRRIREAADTAHHRKDFQRYVAELRRTNRIRPKPLNELDAAHL
jgi:hypothetical protein